MAKSGIARALMDTGADVSIIKLQAFDRERNINFNERINLDGFTSISVSTVGTSIGQIKIKGDLIEQKFHIVPNTVKMTNYDVILGQDFLTKNKVILNFETGTFYVNTGVKKAMVVVKSKGILKRDKNALKDKKTKSINKNMLSKN